MGVEHRDAANHVFGIDLRVDMGRRAPVEHGSSLYRRNVQSSAIATFIL